MKNLALAVAASAVLALTGCASIVSQSEYPVRFTSSPNAAFNITNNYGVQVHSGKTPETVVLSASSGFFQPATYFVRFTAQGHDPKEIMLKSSLDGWVIGNIILGGPIGLVIDGATGAMWALPGRRSTTLNPSASTSAMVPDLRILSYEDLSDSELASLIEID